MRIIMRGTVQGVGFRPAVYRTATKLGLSGNVWNDGSDVIIDIDDGERFLKDFLNDLPPLASIEDIERIDLPFNGNGGFSIVRSRSGSSGVSIPTDLAMCNDCLKDLTIGRRKDYPFTSCTNCGPRFTLLSKLPYDRSSTAMSTFDMCPDCRREYDDPENRRFHHQTICCERCGPSYRLIDDQGITIDGDPISTFGNLLRDGKIGIIKSWGGMHICCTLDNIARMRKWYKREQKPFAIMVRDQDSLKGYCEPNDDELKEITSPHRPIVLVKKVDTEITELISPGLDSIGVFLPYSGIQHMIFGSIDEDALVMTSANVPGEPMILEDRDIMGLGADAYLLHNQPIVNRADDSVLRMYGGTYFLRRSRGHIPSYLSIGLSGEAVSLGAQENLTGSVAKNGRIYPTQHIGNGEGLGVVEYLEDAVRTQMGFLDCFPDAIAVDLHPGYINRGLGKRLAEEFDSELVEVQHHWAHAASLLVEENKHDIVALTLDGSGHGTDDTVWGGEVLSADLSGFKRVAHLEEIPLLGSEKALYDLRRLKFAIDVKNGSENSDFNDTESSILRKMMYKSVECTSMGRLLDALSYTLGVCSYRTYDGEPAMKLEPLLASGKLIPGFETEIIGDTIKTADLFSRIDNSQRPADIAYSIVYNVMRCLTESAIYAADENGIGSIGITGGVSYNSVICDMFKEMAGNSGHELIFHRNIPNGDGGISVGQAAVALKRIQ